MRTSSTSRVRPRDPPVLASPMDKARRPIDPLMSAALPVPGRFGDYDILREVGRGGMGVVYEAVQGSLGRQVALKVLPSHRHLPPSQRERFLREARAAARLHHSQIVPVFSVGECDGIPFYAMQFIPGQGLDAVLEELRRIRAGPVAGADERGGAGTAPTMAVTPAQPAGQGAGIGEAAPPSSTWVWVEGQAHEAPPAGRARQAYVDKPSSASGGSEAARFRGVARMGLQVAEALAYAHDHGVVHRDIKPSNLLLDTSGTVWVTDFGLAKTEGADGLTEAGDIVGTLRYMAPERFEGRSDPRGDVYALGVTLYELLTLRRAFEGPDRARLIERVRHEEPEPPRRLDPRVPRDLETVVLKAMAKDPAARYATARALAEDLRRFLEDRPIGARPSPTWERAWRWARRNRTVAALLALLVLLLVGGTLGSTAAALRMHDLAAREHAAGVSASAALVRERDSTRRATEKTGELERELYLSRIAQAQSEWLSNDTAGAERRLAECPSHLRGWEWSYVRRLCHMDQRTFTEPRPVHAVALSRDGRRLASGGGEWPALAPPGTGALTVREVMTGRVLWARPGLNEVLLGLAFHPDGRTLAIAGGCEQRGATGALTLRDAASGRVLFRRHEPGALALCVAFRGDGRQVAAGYGRYLDTGFAGHVRLWDMATGSEVARLPGPVGGVTSVAYSPDSRRLALAGTDVVDVWNLGAAEPRPEQSLRAPAGQHLLTVRFSPDGRQLATAGWDRSVTLWDAATGRKIRALIGHTGFVQALAFRPDGRQLASASEDQTVKLWETATGREVATLRGHAGFAMGVAFGPDGDLVASGGLDQAVKLWSAGVSHPLVLANDSYVDGLAFSPDGTRLATAPGAKGTDPDVKLWDVATGRRVRGFRGRAGRARRVLFRPDGRSLVTFGVDGLVHVLGAHDGCQLARFPIDVDDDLLPTYSWAFRPDGLQGAKGGLTGAIVLWDLSTGRVVRRLASHTAPVAGLAYAPGGRLLASSAAPVDPSGNLRRGGEVRLWDVSAGRVLHTLRRGDAAFRVLKFSPDGRRLALADGGFFGRSGVVHLLDVATGRDLLTLRGHSANIWDVAFSADGLRLASASIDRTVKLWDTATGEEILTLRGHTAGVLRLAFSPDGFRLASGSIDWTARIWDAAPLRPESFSLAAARPVAGRP